MPSDSAADAKWAARTGLEIGDQLSPRHEAREHRARGVRRRSSLHVRIFVTTQAFV